MGAGIPSSPVPLNCLLYTHITPIICDIYPIPLTTPSYGVSFFARTRTQSASSHPPPAVILTATAPFPLPALFIYPPKLKHSQNKSNTVSGLRQTLSTTAIRLWLIPNSISSKCLFETPSHHNPLCSQQKALSATAHGQ